MRWRRLAARWVFPMVGPPIEHGAVLIDPEGRLQAVGPNAAVPHPEHVAALAFDDAALLPGLINTHTHLELTGLEGQIAEAHFPTWIARLRQLKSTRTPGDFIAAARRGVQDCFASGVTTIADTGDSGTVIQALSEADGSGIAYQEVFGSHPAEVEKSLAGLRQKVAEMSRWATRRVRLGVSPHAPYTVSGALFRAVADWARSERLPLAVHIAESKDEAQLLLSGTGGFAEVWRDRGIPLPLPSGRTPIQWLQEHAVLSANALCIHAVQATPADVERLCSSGAAVAHCPLSNRAHGHGAAPLQAYLDAGIRVGVGTDSVVSVGRLDLLAEARAARRLAGLSAHDALELCTISAARALGVEAEVGSLRPGKWADCAVIHLGQPDGDPVEHLLASDPADVMLTCVAGRVVYRRS